MGWSLCVSFLLVFHSADAQNLSKIRGKITIVVAEASRDERRRMAATARYGVRAPKDSVPNRASTPPAKLSERAVVYLESDELDRGRYSLPPKKPVLEQKELQFHPQVLPILIGSTVEFPNGDNLFHNVFSYSRTKEFDLGRYPMNDSRSVTFDRAGPVKVYCDIHSHMSATILVLRHPFFGVPDDDGDYVIAEVPEGKYRLVLWYGRDVVERRPVTVKEGETLEVNFTY